MDVTKAYSIAYKGLKNGRHDFAFDVDGSLFEAFESPEIRDGACRVRVGLTRSETMLRAEVAIEGYVVVACDRCLEDCRVPVAFEGELLVKFSDEIRDYDGEVMWLSPAETEVDLSQYIYESIVLSLPYQRVHPDGECDPGRPGPRVEPRGEPFGAGGAETAPGGGRRDARSLRNGIRDYVKLINSFAKWHILNTKSRRRDAIREEPTTRLSFRR